MQKCLQDHQFQTSYSYNQSAGRQMADKLSWWKNRSKPGKGSETREGANAPIVRAGFDE